MIGRVLGSYRLVAKIGEGGMGAVYRAVDEMLDREVAIKAVRPDLAREPHIAERFRSEARLLAKVQHPAIATIYSFFQAGDDNEELFLAMEFVRGRTLAEVIAAEGPMPQARVARLMGTAFEGIDHAHESGIIHRDLKPENLMLTDGERVKVMDFGIARLTGESHLTRTGLLVGTLRYMAPEQIRGEEVDRRTDVYALGVVLYQLLTGRVPFDGNTDYSILRAQLEDAPPALRGLAPAVSPEVERTVLRALAKDPADRFATVAELGRALRLALGPSPETGVRPLPVRDLVSDLDSTLPLSRSTTRAPVAPPPPAAPAPPASRPTAPSRRPPEPAPPSLPTAETPRGRPEPAVPPPPPAAASTSYRPIPGGSGRTWGVAALAALVLAAGGFGLWRHLRPAQLPPGESPADRAEGGPSEPDSGGLQPEGGTATSGAALAPGGGSGGGQEGTGIGTGAAAQRPAPPPLPSAGTKPSPQPSPSAPSRGAAPSSGAAGAAGTGPAGGPAGTGTATPGEPRRDPEPATAVPAPPPAEEEAAGSDIPADLPPLEEMKRLSSHLVEEGERLTDLYQAFLDQKEERNEELTANDLALRDEIEAMNGAAERFDAFFNAGLLSRARNRMRRPNEGANRLDLQRRSQILGAKISRVDQLMAAVGPDADVRQSWGKIRADWRRARQRMAP